MKKMTIKVKSTNELQKKIRHSWDFRPTTRIVESKKTYSRKGAKDWQREMC